MLLLICYNYCKSYAGKSHDLGQKDSGKKVIIVACIFPLCLDVDLPNTPDKRQFTCCSLLSLIPSSHYILFLPVFLPYQLSLATQALMTCQFQEFCSRIIFMNCCIVHVLNKLYYYYLLSLQCEPTSDGCSDASPLNSFFTKLKSGQTSDSVRNFFPQLEYPL